MRRLLTSGGDHRPAFANGDRGRFLDVDVLARLAGVDRLHGVPMIGRGDHDRVDVLAETDVTVVAVGFDSGSGNLHGAGQP